MSKSSLNLPDLAKNKTLIIVLVVVVLFLLIICLTLWLPYLIISDGDDEIVDEPWQPSTCEELLGKAMDASYDGCETIGSNQICYGNFHVSAQLAAESIAQFASLGDTIPVNQLVTLNTSPMDTDRDIWGIAVFRLQANMPGTIPGQNATFLVFGDTGLYNFSGDMYSIFFSTGIGSVTCSQVPDGLMVDVPDGSGIVFTANGVELALEGDAVLTANPGENMSVSMLNGSGVVTSDGQSQDISAGQILTVPIGDDLQAEGAPSNPIDLPPDVALELCLLTQENCDPADPLSWLPTITPGGDLEPPTNTPVPVEPGQPTNTSVPLATTQTSTPSTPTDTLPPGVTPPTPTDTPTPTKTSTPTNTPSDTPTPTDTPPAASCTNISLSGYAVNDDTVSLSITNSNSEQVLIAKFNLTWNEGVNGLLEEIDIDGNPLWGQGNPTASSGDLITLSANNPHRPIGGGETKTLAFIFENAPAELPSSLTVEFDIGCPKSP